MKKREKTGFVSAAGKNLPGSGSGPYPRNSYKIWLAVLAVLTLLCFNSLAHHNMAGNEVDRLIVSKQYVDPSWIPGDWYLNQPIGYQALFANIFGRLVQVWGFLVTSIVGRFFCYSLIASALVFLGRRLALGLPLLLLVVALFLKKHSAAALEWMIGPLEGKVVAYGLVLWAIERMLNKSHRTMALLLGLATSFHVLVGGYATLSVLGWISLRWKTRMPDVREAVQSVLLYLAGSAFAIRPVLSQISSPPILSGALQPSYIYVFLRNPRHLNPLGWNSWVSLFLYLLLLFVSFGLLYRRRLVEEAPEPYRSRSGLFEFTLISMVPFALGLAVAPFDRQGHFLQYYLFRFGDVMLPLAAYLLAACALQDLLFERSCVTGRTRKGLLLTGVLILCAVYVIEAHGFWTDLSALRQFPGPQQKVYPDQKEMFKWLKDNTPRDSTVVSCPDLDQLSWLSERPTIAKFKLIPNTGAAILQWYQRIDDLSGNNSPWKYKSFRGERDKRLAADYLSLTTAQVRRLMARYKADYFLTTVKQRLKLPVAHRNASYVLYRREGLASE
jgi:hypothetical protein